MRRHAESSTRRRAKSSAAPAPLPLSPLLVLTLLAFAAFACSSRGPAAAESAARPGGAESPAAPPAAAAQAAQPRPAQTSGAKVYRGTIGGRGVELKLTREGERLTGVYTYDGIGQELRLEGSAAADGKLTLSEYDAAGKQTGKFACEPGGVGDSLALEIDLECQWSKPDGGGSVYAGLTEQHAAFTRGWRVAPKRIENRKRGVRVSYPQLAAARGGALTPGAEGFNRRVAEVAGKVVRDFTAEPHEERMYLEINYDVLLATDELVSVELAEDNYYGGAHPNVNFYSVTYDLRANRELRLADLFKPGTDFERALRLHAFKDINRRAADVQKENARASGAEATPAGEELMPADREEQITAWALTPRGLLVYFSFPHVMAAFDRNFVPYAAVRDLLSADGPASAFARGR